MSTEPFAVAELEYLQLMAARKQGSLSAGDFRGRLRQLAVTDMEGRRWLLGPEDGQWHRRDRDRWITAEPPRRLVCTNCAHHNILRHRFCVECGKSLQGPTSPPSGSKKGPQDGRRV